MSRSFTVAQALAHISGGTYPLAQHESAAECQFKLLKSHGLTPQSKLLEIGSGFLLLGKRLLAFLDGGNYTLIEPEAGLVETARQHWKLPELQHHTCLDFYVGGQYDVIHSHSVLSHASAEQLRQFFSACQRQLRPGGVALASLRLGLQDTNAAHWVYPGVTYFTEETIRKTAAEYGLLVDRMDNLRTAMMRATKRRDHHHWIALRPAVSPPQQVSVVLLNWKRSQHLPTIVQHLRQYPFIDDIVIWDNSCTCPPIDDDRVKIIRSSDNVQCWGRVLAAEHTKHELLYTQDDDMLLDGMAMLLAAAVQTPDSIVAARPTPHIRDANLLIGWGAFFRKSWLNETRRFAAAFPGELELLHRESDLIFATLHGKLKSVICPIDWLRGADGQLSSNDANALWVQPNHWEHRQRAAAMTQRLLPSTAETYMSNFPIPSQTTVTDKHWFMQMIRFMQENNYFTHYRYLEIGSYLGGTLCPPLADENCVEVFSIDKRPGIQVDARQAKFDYRGVTTEVMLQKLKEVPGLDLTKLKTYDGDARDCYLISNYNIAFIDGEHTDEAAFSDFLSIYKNLMPYSVVLFHDANLVSHGIDNVLRFLRFEKRQITYRCFEDSSMFLLFIDWPHLEIPQVLRDHAGEQDWLEFKTRAREQLLLTAVKNRLHATYSLKPVPVLR